MYAVNEKMKSTVIILFIILLSLSGCGHKRYDITMKGDRAEIHISRFEDDIFGVEPGAIMSDTGYLRVKYHEFARIFGYVINIGDIDAASWGENMLMFATDKQNREVYLQVKEQFPSLADVEKELSDAWTRYTWYFPGARVPEIFSFVSGFNNSMVVGDSVLGIGLDRYLGTGCKYYPMLGIYNYEIRKMVPEKIPSDCFYAWAASTWMLDERAEGGNTLLASMLHEGKLVYFTRCMLPSEPDSLLFGFTGEQLKFCDNNEEQMWEYIIGNDLLFITDPFTIRKLTGEAPFTSFFTNESPGRAAVWLAYRIIDQYMENNREVSLAELMDRNDYQNLLAGARYTPR